jgi:hypothetical protein
MHDLPRDIHIRAIAQATVPVFALPTIGTGEGASGIGMMTGSGGGVLPEPFSTPTGSALARRGAIRMPRFTVAILTILAAMIWLPSQTSL